MAKKDLRVCRKIDGEEGYLFHAWVKKITSDGEVLVAIVEDSCGKMCEIKWNNLLFC